MSEGVEVVRFVADRGDRSLRLDQAILRHLHGVSPLSRTRVQAWIDAGLVRVDGVTARRASTGLRDGASVAISLPADVHVRQAPLAEDMPLSIVFEDDCLLALDKPAGLVVHPTYKQASGTLLNGILTRKTSGAGEPGIITRLDRQTSGLVLVAMAPGVHRTVQSDVTAGRVTKEYLALVRGGPRVSRGTIDAALGHDPTDRRRIVPLSAGREAVTRFEVLARGAGRTLLRCELVTGRTHQIRTHLASQGWPLVGDPVYGSSDPVLGGRHALHAWRLRMPHPRTRSPLTLVAPVAADLQAAAPHLFADAASLLDDQKPTL